MTDITIPRDELVERVARLYEDKWGIMDHWLARAAIDMALEEAAKVADYKAGSLTQSRDTHAMVQGAMAEDIAAAIRALISKETA
jgi:hypothetical protein